MYEHKHHDLLPWPHFIGVMGVILAPWAHRLLHITQAEARQ